MTGPIGQQQRGVALLTILIMVVLATLLAASIVRQQGELLEDTQRLMQTNQGLAYSDAAEQLAASLLRPRPTPNGQPPIDTLHDSWALPLPAQPIEGGFIRAQLQDDNRRFNVNSLTQPDGSVNPAARQVFERLLKKLALDPQLADAVIDWQDPDQITTGSLGAENDFYRSQPRGYTAGNQMFADVAQLQLVRGMAGTAYRQLLPYVTALPRHETKINVNTADPFLLSCLAESLVAADVTNQIQQRRTQLQDFHDLDEFWTLPAFAKVDATAKTQLNSLIDVRSDHFELTTDVQMGERHRYQQSRLVTQDDGVKVYARRWLSAIEASSVLQSASP